MDLVSTSWLTPTVLFCVLNLMIGTIFITSILKPHKKQRKSGDSEEEPPPPPPPEFVRVPSFLERVKSINLSRYRSLQPEPAAHAAEERPDEHVSTESHHVTRSKTSTEEEEVEAEAEEKAAAPKRGLKRSESEKVAPAEVKVDQRMPATAREFGGGGGEDEAVDARADDFINRFRQQLKLQRMDSILRYKEMLKRGTGR